MKKICSPSNIVEFALTASFLLVYIVSTFAMGFNVFGGTAAVHAYYPPLPENVYDYRFFVSIAGIPATLIPWAFRKITRINLPPQAAIIYVAFVFCGIFLGEVMRFYYIVPHFDTFLHVFSGGALCVLGFVIIQKRNEKAEGTPIGPILAAAFALCFATTLGVAWEMIEFILDSIFDANAQKYTLECGTPLVGRDALMDTMVDFIANAAGALPVAAAFFLPDKFKERFLAKFRRRGTS